MKYLVLHIYMNPWSNNRIIRARIEDLVDLPIDTFSHPAQWTTSKTIQKRIEYRYNGSMITFDEWFYAPLDSINILYVFKYPDDPLHMHIIPILKGMNYLILGKDDMNIVANL